MKVIDVYQQYFAGKCVFHGVERRGADVRLTAISDAGDDRPAFSLYSPQHLTSRRNL